LDTPLALFGSKPDNPRSKFSTFSATLKILKQIPDVLRSHDNKWVKAKISKRRNQRWHPYSTNNKRKRVTSDLNVSQVPVKDVEVQVCHLFSGLPTTCLGHIESMQSGTIQVDELPSGQSMSRWSGEIKSIASATLEDKPESILEVAPLEGQEVDTDDTSVCQDRRDLLANCQPMQEGTTHSAGKMVRASK
jgi:hypothetical protein